MKALTTARRRRVTEKDPAPYTTPDEIAYLNGIADRVRPELRDKILRGYIASTKTRQRWGNVASAAVIAHAERENTHLTIPRKSAILPPVNHARRNATRRQRAPTRSRAYDHLRHRR